MYFGMMILFSAAFLREPVIVSPFCQNLVKVPTVPSASCTTVGNLPSNIGNCLQTCMTNGRPFYMISQHVVTHECLCCTEPPTGSGYTATDWMSFSLACPVGYTEMVTALTRTCLRFVSAQTNYTGAVRDCQQDDGDLLRIDSLAMGYIFLDLIYNYTDPADRTHGEIWIQGIRDVNDNWAFHDGSLYPDFMNNYIIESHQDLENRLRYVISQRKLMNSFETALHSYVCEYRFIKV